ncbi:MAG: hypothetical protein RL375_335 [Pseudomonadota bacterium]
MQFDSTTITMRPASAADAPRVASLLIETRAAFMPYAPSVHTDEEVHVWVATHLLAACGVTVVEVDARVVAVLASERVGTVSWIVQMAVDPALAGRGIGSVLIEHALDTLCVPIRLYTFQANIGARRFYERHGFQPVEFTDGQSNEEQCPDVLYEWTKRSGPAQFESGDRVRTQAERDSGWS